MYAPGVSAMNSATRHDKVQSHAAHKLGAVSKLENKAILCRASHGRSFDIDVCMTVPTKNKIMVRYDSTFMRSESLGTQRWLRSIQYSLRSAVSSQWEALNFLDIFNPGGRCAK